MATQELHEIYRTQECLVGFAVVQPVFLSQQTRVEALKFPPFTYIGDNGPVDSLSFLFDVHLTQLMPVSHDRTDLLDGVAVINGEKVS